MGGARGRQVVVADQGLVGRCGDEGVGGRADADSGAHSARRLDIHGGPSVYAFISAGISLGYSCWLD